MAAPYGQDSFNFSVKNSSLANSGTGSQGIRTSAMMNKIRRATEAARQAQDEPEVPKEPFYVVQASNMTVDTTDYKSYSMTSKIGRRIYLRPLPDGNYLYESYNEKVIVPPWMLSKTLGGVRLAKDPNKAGNVGAINDLTTLQFSEYFYQPIPAEKGTMQNANLETKWQEMIEFCTNVIKGVTVPVIRRIKLGDFWKVDSRDPHNENKWKFYFNVSLKIQPIRGSGNSIKAFSFVAYSGSKSLYPPSGSSIVGQVIRDANPSESKTSLASAQLKLMRYVFLALRIGETAKDTDLIFEHDERGTGIDISKQDGESEAERQARIRAEALARIAEANKRANERANEKAQTNAFESDIQAMIAEQARREKEYRDNVKAEAERLRRLEEENRRIIQMNKTLEEQRRQSAEIAKKQAQMQIAQRAATQERQKAIAQAQAQAKANYDDLMSMFTRKPPKETKIEIGFTDTSLAEMNKGKDDFGLLDTVQEWQEQPVGTGTTVSEDIAAIDFEENERRWEEEQGFDDMPMRTGNPTPASEEPENEGKSNKMLWIILAVVAVLAIAGGVGYWFFRKKQKARAIFSADQNRNSHWS